MGGGNFVLSALKPVKIRGLMDREPSKPQQKRTLTSQQSFLSAFGDSGCVRLTAKAAGITRKTHYSWLRKDPGYADAFTETKRIAGDYIESIAVERATVGWKEAVYYQGKVCGYVRRFSDGLLMQLLKGLKPDVYGVKRQETSSPQGAPVQARIEVVFVRPVSEA